MDKILIAGGSVVTVDDGGRVLDPRYVFIESDRIPVAPATNGAESNHNQDMLDVLKTTALLHRVTDATSRLSVSMKLRCWRKRGDRACLFGRASVTLDGAARTEQEVIPEETLLPQNH